MAGFSHFPPVQEITSGMLKVMRIQVECSLPSGWNWSKVAAYPHAQRCSRRTAPLLPCTLLKELWAVGWCEVVPLLSRDCSLHHITHQERSVAPLGSELQLAGPKSLGYWQGKCGVGQLELLLTTDTASVWESNLLSHTWVELLGLLASSSNSTLGLSSAIMTHQTRPSPAERSRRGNSVPTRGRTWTLISRHL